MKILVLNSGSSSLKFTLFEMDNESVLAKGSITRKNETETYLMYQNYYGVKIKKEIGGKDPKEFIELALKILYDKQTKVITSYKEIAGVGHRILHGGVKMNAPVIIDSNIKQLITDCIELAPLHNPAALDGIEAIERIMPGVKNVAVWDTAFGSTLQPKAYLYAIPREYYEKYHIRRYGFHGISHSYVAKETIRFAKLDPDNAKVIVCHLGSGVSVSASIGGKCVDTSMGFSPMEGLVMSLRCGDIDPSIIEYLCKHENKSIGEMIRILNKKSGIYGMTNRLSSDIRTIYSESENGNEIARVALETFTYHIAKYIGAYAAAMNGVDAISLTSGTGENAIWFRKMLVNYLGYLGITLDNEKSEATIRKNGIISTKESKVKLCVIPTNEELAIARECLGLVK